MKIYFGAIVMAFVLTQDVSAQCVAVDISKDELIDLYQVPVNEKPAWKTEWTVDSPHYFRLVLEVADSKSGPWNLVQAWGPSTRFTKGVCTYMLDKKAIRTNSEKRIWVISARLGGQTGPMKMWASCEFSIPAADVMDQMTAVPENPSELLSVVSQGRVYRLRMEKNPQPFPEK